MAVTLPLHACYTTVTRPFGQFDVNFTFTVNLQCNVKCKVFSSLYRKFTNPARDGQRSHGLPQEGKLAERVRTWPRVGVPNEDGRE